MASRVLTSVVWRQQDPRRVELAYEDGGSETVAGTHADAVKMAEEAGLRLGSSPLGMVRWARGATSRDGRSPKRIGPWLSS